MLRYFRVNNPLDHNRCESSVFRRVDGTLQRDHKLRYVSTAEVICLSNDFHNLFHVHNFPVNIDPELFFLRSDKQTLEMA